MMEAAGPSSPFDFDSMQMGTGNGDFNISEFVTSPPDNDINSHANTDDFMASFSLDGAGGESADQHSSSSHFNQDPTSSPTTTVDYPPMTISQLQQLHSQIQQQSSPSGSASPSVHVGGPAPPPPSEAELQSILDGLMNNSSNTNSPQGLVDAGNMDLGSLMGQLAGMGQNGAGHHQHQNQQQEGPSAFASPAPPPPQLQQGHNESTATALQRLQQLQQLQQYQSQFIQQQVSPSLPPFQVVPRGNELSALPRLPSSLSLPPVGLLVRILDADLTFSSSVLISSTNSLVKQPNSSRRTSSNSSSSTSFKLNLLSTRVTLSILSNSSSSNNSTV